METLNNKTEKSNILSNHPNVLPEYVAEYIANTLEYVWKLGKGNNSVDFKGMAEALKSDIFGK